MGMGEKEKERALKTPLGGSDDSSIPLKKLDVSPSCEVPTSPGLNDSSSRGEFAPDASGFGTSDSALMEKVGRSMQGPVILSALASEMPLAIILSESKKL